MKSYGVLIGAILLTALACRHPSAPTSNSAPAAVVRLPAQWEKQDAVWLMFPPIDHVHDLQNQQVTRELALTLAPHVRVRLIVANDSLERVAREILPDSLFTHKRIELFRIPYAEFWTRDVGAVFVVRDGQLTATDFNFDAWSYADSSEVETDEQVDETIAAQLGIPSLSSQLIHEGGNLESNGQGTLIVCGSVELQRNPGRTRAEIEAELKRLTGAVQIIWLERGVNEDDSTFDSPIALPNGQMGYTLLTTGGHTDEFVRFVNDSTVLLAEPAPEDLAEDPISRENKIRMDKNLAILQSTRLPDGRPLRVVRIPTPVTLSREIAPGDWVYDAISTVEYNPDQPFPMGKTVRGIAATSYCNFLITNGLVIGQRYWKPGLPEKVRRRDEAAESVLKTMFPDRKIVLLDALAINYGGGGIHCITMQQPAI